MIRVLIVDDEPFIIKLTVRQLEGLGLNEVQAFLRGEDALAALSGQPGHWGLVICDLQMPEMDGIEVIRHLGTAGFAGSLMLTTGEDEQILKTAARLARAHGLHVVGAVLKPVTPEDLQAATTRHRSRAAPGVRRASRTYAAEELRNAISSRELTNYYQPKVDVATGALVGVESLVRWQHPTDGMVFPDQFIELAERSGLIDPLTEVVLEGALQQCRAWNDAGLSISMAVNVSLDNLTNLRFPEVVAAAAGEAGVPLAQLILEVTESRLALEMRAPLDVLSRLRLRRVGLSIDDFGTGHSSLKQLRDFPFGELKVDRGFVHGAWHDPTLRAILAASLHLGRELGMRLVAEGVEDRSDWDFLRACGCDRAQGYFIARPMPGEELLAWAGGWEERRRQLVRGEGPVHEPSPGGGLGGDD